MIRVEVSFETSSPLGAALAGMRPRFRSGLIRTLAEGGYQPTNATPPAGFRDPAPTQPPVARRQRRAAGRGEASKVVEHPSLTTGGGGVGDAPAVPASVTEPLPVLAMNTSTTPAPASEVAVESPEEKRARLRRTIKNLGLNVR